MPLPKSPPHMSVRSPNAQLAVLYEHPQWFQPLFAALDRRGLSYEAIKLSGHSFDPASQEVPAPLVLSRVAQSSFLRETEHPIFYAEALLDHWAGLGARVLNGADVLAIDSSKASNPIDIPSSSLFASGSSWNVRKKSSAGLFEAR